VIKLNSFILGLLFAVVLFVVVGLVFYVGYRIGKKKQPIVPTVPTEDDDKEIKRIEDLHKGFVKLMNYDFTTAVQRKKV
jgi:hypothetical protein